MSSLPSLTGGEQGQQDTRCFSPREESTKENEVTSEWFTKEIKILSAENEGYLATGLLDTQCWAGNWISYRLVERIGKSALISTEFDPLEVVDASGRQVTPCGVVNIEWKWHPRGTRVHVCQFYVLPSSDHLDVVFGAEYIASERLIQMNETAFLPLVRDQKSGRAHEAAIKQAEKRQQEEKAALEERRKQEKQKEQKQGES